MRRASAALALAAAACAAPEPAPPAAPEAPVAPLELRELPATWRNTPSCGGCLELTLTLRPDGAFAVRERLGTSEFHDFGRWRGAGGGALELAGTREGSRRYAPRPGGVLDALAGTPGGDLRRAEALEPLPGPFRLTGLYDGAQFKECLTGLEWRLEDTRAAAALRQEYLSRETPALLVALDARFEPQGRGEALRVLRTASILNERGCPG